MTEKAEHILKQVLEEQMEKEAARVPDDNSIREKHTFSANFLQNMSRMTEEERKVAVMKKKKETTLHWRGFMKVAAACLALVLAFGAGATVTDSLRMGSSEKATMQMADETAGAESAETEIAEETETYEAADTGENAVASAGGVSKETAKAAVQDATADEDVAADTASGENVTTQKLVYTSHISVDTTEFDNYIAAVRQKVSELGGYIEQSEISGDADNESRNVSMTIRVPAEKRNELTETVRNDAKVTNQSERVEDITLEYVDTASHIQALKTEQETLMGLLEKADSIETTLAIQNQLTQVRYELESYSSSLKVMQNQVDYSTLYLNAYEVKKVMATSQDSFLTRLTDRFTDSLSALGHGCEEIVLFFLGNLPVLAALSVVIVVLLGIVRRVHRKKREKTAEKKEEL